MTAQEERGEGTRRQRTMTPLTWAVFAVAIVGFIGGVVWLGATNSPSGNRLIENPGAVLVAIVSAVAVLGTPFAAQLAAVKKQVQNSHDKNLRDDIDDKHIESTGKIDGVDAKLDRIFTALNRLDGRTANVESTQAVILRTLARESDRIDELEKTQPPKEKP